MERHFLKKLIEVMKYIKLLLSTFGCSAYCLTIQEILIRHAAKCCGRAGLEIVQSVRNGYLSLETSGMLLQLMSEESLFPWFDVTHMTYCNGE